MIIDGVLNIPPLVGHSIIFFFTSPLSGKGRTLHCPADLIMLYEPIILPRDTERKSGYSPVVQE